MYLMCSVEWFGLMPRDTVIIALMFNSLLRDRYLIEDEDLERILCFL